MGADSLSLFSTIPKEKVYRCIIPLLVNSTWESPTSVVGSLTYLKLAGWIQSAYVFGYSDEKKGSLCLMEDMRCTHIFRKPRRWGCVFCLELGHGTTVNQERWTPRWVLEGNCGSNSSFRRPKVLAVRRIISPQNQ